MSNISEYDVTGTIVVSNPAEVRDEVRRIFTTFYAEDDFDSIEIAFNIFRRLFQGELPGYVGCDTVYHDMQHSLDVTLAMARLLGGHERATQDTAEQFGVLNFSLGIVGALFHDAGYIQTLEDTNHLNGAQYTKTHIARGAQFLRKYMRRFGLADHVDDIVDVVHFTGYEKPLAELATDKPVLRKLGKLLGTADLVAQMSDRCYLEKCRDRLYSEFVLGGVAVDEGQDGVTRVNYHSGEDLLQKTPEFFDSVTTDRLDGEFDKSYGYFEHWFDGENPYLSAIQRNLDYLQSVLDGGDWSKLRRTPPVFTSQEDSLSDTQEMVAAHLQKMIGGNTGS